MDMEIDQDDYIDDDDDIFNEDPVEKFLGLKFRSLKEANQHLKVSVEEFASEIKKKRVLGSGSLVVGPVWKRITHGKVLFGMTISSKKRITLENLDLSFKWNPEITPLYTTKLFGNSSTNDSTLIVFFEATSFIKHEIYDAKITLFHNDDDGVGVDGTTTAYNNNRTTVETVETAIKASDFANDDLEVKNIDVINGLPDAVRARIACSSQIKLAVALSMGVLRDYLIIDCMFRRLHLNKDHEDDYYYLDGVSQHLNGCFLRYQDEEDYYTEVTLFFRDKAHLYHILHFLHSNIKDIAGVVPLKCKSLLRSGKFHVEAEDEDRMYESQRTRAAGDVHEFGESLLRQFDCIIDFHKNVLGNEDVPKDRDISRLYRNFRRSLTQIERHTDLLYQKLLLS